MLKNLKLKELKKIDSDGCFTGVCAGFAYWLKVPTWIIRGLLILACCFGFSIIIYLIFAFILPEYDEVPYDYVEICE